MSTDISTGNRVVARVLAPIVQTSRPSNGGGCFSVGCVQGRGCKYLQQSRCIMHIRIVVVVVRCTPNRRGRRWLCSKNVGV
ncbi:ORF36 [Cydia pomonella granulovirus]|uniref:ORF36 n=1 Tax=Cydia pomonella granulosis virus (isolate Mexico/1963) TaxID=654905 RepID=Q91F17_GVCPM|nr:ORF36 [Cydia pomonella granulovirus]AAK70696.1 ORF36 [Cydia pomonella granulovirus]